MARSRFFLISTIVVIFTGVGAWYELERAELVVNATASPVPVTVAIASRGDLPNAGAASAPPDPIKAGVAEKLFRLDCGRSLANDESVWTPGENVGRSIEFSSTCWLIKHGSEWLLWDAGVPEAAHNDPRGWSTLPKLIVYHLDRTMKDQLAEIGLDSRDITRVAISHTHGDHIGNVAMFANATILMQQARVVHK